MEVVAFVSQYGSLISGGMSAISAISQGNQQKAASKYNAKVAENQAIAARQQAGANAEMQRRSSEKKIGSMQAAYAASGVSMEGSALDILEESARNAEMDRQNILYGGELRAIGSEGTAMLEKSQGANAQTSGYLSAAGSLFKAGASAYGSSGGDEKGSSSQAGRKDYYGDNVNASFDTMLKRTG
jgi:hypothetical protein